MAYRPIPAQSRRGLTARMPVQAAQAPSRGLAYRPLNPLQGLAGGGLRGIGQLLMALGSGRPEMAGQAFSSGLDQFDATQRQNAADAQNRQMFDLEMEDRQFALDDRAEDKAAAAAQKAAEDAAIDRLVQAGVLDASEGAAMKAGVGKLGDFKDAEIKPPASRTRVSGGKEVFEEFDPVTRTWKEISSGDRWKPEGSGIQIDTNGDGVPDVTIGGGGMPKLTEAQSTGTMQFSLADQANKTLGEADVELTSAPDYIASQFGTVGNYFKSEKYQNAEQAATVLAEQYLRALTGAAAPEPEVKRTAASIMPRPGDGPEVIAQKRATRQQIIEALRIKAGPGAVITPVVPPASGEQSNMPKVGDVDGGFRFKGGNPGDPDAWEKVQ